MTESRKNVLSARQCRAGRAWLGWSQAELAEHAGVSVRAIATFEAGRVASQHATLMQLRRVLEEAGILFEPEGGVTLAP